MDNFDTSFWQHPPWLGETQKHRVGLSPANNNSWLTGHGTNEKLNNKIHHLQQRYMKVVATMPGHDSLPNALQSCPWPSAPRQSYPDLIANLAVTVAPDLCVIDVEDEQKLVAACLCAPSYWRLSEKIGLPLGQIHGPVNGLNAKLGGRIEHFISHVPVQRPFQRRNWFLHTSDALYQVHDEEDDLSLPIENWFVRCESQGLCRLSSRYLLFTIDVHCEPLRNIVDYKIAHESLISGLAQMNDDEANHFGGREKALYLIELLEQRFEH